MILNNEPLPSHVLLLENVVYFVQCLELEGQSGNKQFLQRGSSPIKALAKVVFPTPFEPIKIIRGWGISNLVFLVSLVIVSMEVSAEKILNFFYTIVYTTCTLSKPLTRLWTTWHTKSISINFSAFLIHFCSTYIFVRFSSADEIITLIVRIAVVNKRKYTWHITSCFTCITYQYIYENKQLWLMLINILNLLSEDSTW